MRREAGGRDISFDSWLNNLVFQNNLGRWSIVVVVRLLSLAAVWIAAALGPPPAPPPAAAGNPPLQGHFLSAFLSCGGRLFVVHINPGARAVPKALPLAAVTVVYVVSPGRQSCSCSLVRNCTSVCVLTAYLIMKPQVEGYGSGGRHPKEQAEEQDQKPPGRRPKKRPCAGPGAPAPAPAPEDTAAADFKVIFNISNSNCARLEKGLERH